MMKKINPEHDFFGGWWDVYMMHGPLLIHGSAAALSIKELATFPAHWIHVIILLCFRTHDLHTRSIASEKSK